MFIAMLQYRMISKNECKRFDQLCIYSINIIDEERKPWFSTINQLCICGGQGNDMWWHYNRSNIK